MRLFQFISASGVRGVGATRSGESQAYLVSGAVSVRELALSAHRNGRGLVAEVEASGFGKQLSASEILSEGRMLVPLDHPDPAHCTLGITGLTHLGSAKSRDAMHAKLNADDLSDSMKMFKLGVDGGKPVAGQAGAQPEWAYKGDGSWAVAPEKSIALPSYADDGGEEAEIAGLYVIADDGSVLRVGYALGNEYSDHVMEKVNYLYLAHSKLRQSSYGPEVFVGELPDSVTGDVKILRDGDIVWQNEFISGEENMCHSIANLEHHHFKYADFRRPGDVHVYYYGASVLSCADGFVMKPGDQSVITCDLFGEPLRNTYDTVEEPTPIVVKSL